MYFFQKGEYMILYIYILSDKLLEYLNQKTNKQIFT